MRRVHRGTLLAGRFVLSSWAQDWRQLRVAGSAAVRRCASSALRSPPVPTSACALDQVAVASAKATPSLPKYSTMSHQRVARESREFRHAPSPAKRKLERLSVASAACAPP